MPSAFRALLFALSIRGRRGFWGWGGGGSGGRYGGGGTAESPVEAEVRSSIGFWGSGRDKLKRTSNFRLKFLIYLSVSSASLPQGYSPVLTPPELPPLHVPARRSPSALIDDGDAASGSAGSPARLRSISGRAVRLRLFRDGHPVSALGQGPVENLLPARRQRWRVICEENNHTYSGTHLYWREALRLASRSSCWCLSSWDDWRPRTGRGPSWRNPPPLPSPP